MQNTISKKFITEEVYKYFSINENMILLNSDDGFFVLDKFYNHSNNKYYNYRFVSLC